jgi:succinate dehydrogenase / fumarate reductase, iron-sulfur subunit
MADEYAPPAEPIRPEEIELWDEGTLWEEGPPREPGAQRREGAPAPGQVRLTLRIRRYNPELRPEPWWDEFAVNMEPTDRLLDALHVVKWYHDGSLALRRSCAHGICGSDAMVIDGRNSLACKVLVRDVAPRVTVEPIRGLPVVKDLIVDMEPFFQGYERMLPYLISDEAPPDRERRQSPEERERFDDTTKCILCAACTTSCPIFWGDGEYVGPAAIVNAHRFIFDSRDQGATERLDILADRTGVFRCRTIFNCTDACPRGIKVTKAIQEVKRAVMFDRL